MIWFWVSAIIGFAVLELSTLKMLFICPLLGAASAAIAKLILPSIAIGWQFLIFTLVSVFLIFAVRPLIKRALKKYKQRTNK